MNRFIVGGEVDVFFFCWRCWRRRLRILRMRIGFGCLYFNWSGGRGERDGRFVKKGGGNLIF